MGLFDSWRRRKRKEVHPVHVKGREIMTTGEQKGVAETSESAPVEVTPDQQAQDASLFEDYQKLHQRREQLQTERAELTTRLDNGELNAKEFRKELMSRIQEAAAVADELKEVTAKLSALGYHGLLA